MAEPFKKSTSINKQQRRIFSAMESWLDRAEGHKGLVQPDIAQMLMEAIAFRQDHCVWDMIEFVIMPNHIHLFFSLLQESLHDVLTPFKRWTGGQALALLSRQDERFWHREWFDHWSRSPEEDERIIAYIRNNPVKAGLAESYELWPYGSWAVSNDR